MHCRTDDVQLVAPWQYILAVQYTQYGGVPVPKSGYCSAVHKLYANLFAKLLVCCSVDCVNETN